LNPEFLFAGHDFTKIREVMKGLKATCIKMLGVDDALLAMTSYTARHPRAWAPSGEMATPGAQRMAAHTWWRSMALTPELQRVAKSKPGAGTSCPPVSATGQTMTMHSKRRNCLTAARAERCVYVLNSREHQDMVCSI
jgi:hypothetical protein